MARKLRFEPEDHGVQKWSAISNGKIVASGNTKPEVEKIAETKGYEDLLFVEHLSLW